MKLRFVVVVFIVTCVSINASGQKTTSKSNKITIQGIISDSTGNPVKGARVLIDSKNTDVVSDNKGLYKVKTRSDAGLISIFTFYNGIAEEKIDGRRTINFILKGKASVQNNKPGNREEDKVVNIGYGSAEKENIAGPVSKADLKKGENVFYSNIYEMIEGTVPGVKVVGNSIQIRGISSINLSSEPLFVVDGMKVNSIENIDPSEVESIEVLKGASATIYGSEGAGGVILIQRKGPVKKKK